MLLRVIAFLPVFNLEPLLLLLLLSANVLSSIKVKITSQPFILFALFSSFDYLTSFQPFLLALRTLLFLCNNVSNFFGSKKSKALTLTSSI